MGDLRSTEEYWDFDPTERAAVTYRIGMGAAKYICEVCFGVIEMVHLSLLASDPAAPGIEGIRRSRRQADVAAEDIAGNWFARGSQRKKHHVRRHSSDSGGKGAG